jgi:hypothetical protein
MSSRLGHDPVALMDAAPPPRIPAPAERAAGAGRPPSERTRR